MNCKKCGSPITENDQFCKNCGTVVTAGEGNHAPTKATVGVTATNQTINQAPNATTTVPNLNQNITGNVNSNTSSNNVNTTVNSGVSNPMNTANSNINSTTQTPVNHMNSTMNTSTPNSNFNQNMNGNQAAWSNYSQPNYNQTPKNDNMKYIIMGISVVIFVIIVIAGLVMLLGNKGKDDNSYSGSGSEISKASTYKVQVGGYTVEVPDTYIYEEINGELAVGDQASTWASRIKFDKGNFSQILGMKAVLQKKWQENLGVTVSEPVEKTVGGVESLIFNIYDGGQKMILVVSKVDANHYTFMIGYSSDGDAGIEILEHVAPIIRSAKYNGESNYMQISSKINATAFAEAIK